MTRKSHSENHATRETPRNSQSRRAASRLENKAASHLPPFAVKAASVPALNPDVQAIHGGVGLPVRGAVMFFDKRRDGRKRIMIHLRAQPRSLPAHDDMLVDIHILALYRPAHELLEAPEPMAEKPQIPIRAISVPQPSSEEVEPPVNPVSIRPASPLHDLADLRIRIQQQPPLVRKSQRLQRPIPLLRPAPIECKLRHPCARRRCDPHRRIRALRTATHTSSARATLARQRGRFAASFFTGKSHSPALGSSFSLRLTHDPRGIPSHHTARWHIARHYAPRRRHRPISERHPR